MTLQSRQGRSRVPAKAPDYFEPQIESVIRKKWSPISPEKEKRLEQLVSWLSVVAVEMDYDPLGLGQSESGSLSVIKKDLRKLMEEVCTYKPSGPILRILSRLGEKDLSQFSKKSIQERKVILGPLVDQRKFKQFTKECHKLVIEELRSKQISAERRGPKAAELPHVIILGICEAYCDITGRSAAAGDRKGLLSACTKIFVILKLYREINVKNVLENFLDQSFQDLSKPDVNRSGNQPPL